MPSVGPFQSQRDCDPKPRVARHELPWVLRCRNPSTATRLRPSAPLPGHSSAAHFAVVIPSNSHTRNPPWFHGPVAPTVPRMPEKFCPKNRYPRPFQVRPHEAFLSTYGLQIVATSWGAFQKDDDPKPQGLRALPIPKGLRLKAQGCEARATLGPALQKSFNRNAVAALRARVLGHPSGARRTFSFECAGCFWPYWER